MRVHGVAWNDSGGYDDPWENKSRDLNYIGYIMSKMGIDYEYWSRSRIHDSLSGNKDVLDCDLIIMHIGWLIRYGGHASKWDSDICRVLNDYDGPVVGFANEMRIYTYMVNVTKPKFGDDILRRPIWFATPRAEIPSKVKKSDIDILGYVTLNQSHAYACHWLDEPGNMERLFKDPVTPTSQIIYGGLKRDRSFQKRIDNVFKTFGYDDCLYYGQIADKYDKLDLAKEWGEKIATDEQLIELNSRCRYSALPGNPSKTYLTSRAFEQGFSDSLVLCDNDYEQEDCGFPVVDYMDTEELSKWRDLPESDRVKMVREQHDRLASIDHYGKMVNMIESMFDIINVRY